MVIQSNIDDALQEVTHAINMFGAPVWVAHVSKGTRDIVPTDIMRELINNASISAGWSYHRGQYVFGRLDAKVILLEWAKANVFAVMTIKDIAQAAGVPQSTVRSMIDTRADVFRKSDGRTFEVRDAQVDRQKEKVK